MAYDLIGCRSKQQPPEASMDVRAHDDEIRIHLFSRREDRSPGLSGLDPLAHFAEGTTDRRCRVETLPGFVDQGVSERRDLGHGTVDLGSGLAQKTLHH